MLSQVELTALESERKYFIENGTDATFFQWLTSKGTNFTCYVNYLNSLDDEARLNNKIDVIRTIIYAIHKPLQFTFFYWTLLIFIIHKFNFKKPVMKIILVHFILRTLGDIVDKLGDLMPRYYSTAISVNAKNETVYDCKYYSPSPEMHPFKWLLTRQIGCTLWCLGEIVADWYPLLRTKAVCGKRKKSIRSIYVTCGIFNMTKVILFIYHYTLSPTELYKEGVYDKTKIDLFYFKYWLIQLCVIYTSAFYDGSVYLVLRKNLAKINQNNFGFIKKFKTISEYRILISAFICATFLPIISFTILAKYYYYYKYRYHNLEFSFDEIRQSINNVQYFMIFIDQILLIRSRDEAAFEVSRPKSSMIFPSSNNSVIINNINTNGNGNNNYYKNQFSSNIAQPMNPVYYYNSLIKEDNPNGNKNNLLDYSYRTNESNNNRSNESVNIVVNNDVYGSSAGTTDSTFTTKSATLANYDDNPGARSDWNYLK
eukprot:jgi/Orpsp1_1/1192250/evm.model.d7180000091715.1